MKRIVFLIGLLAMVISLTLGCSNNTGENQTGDDNEKPPELKPIMTLVEYPACDGVVSTINLAEKICSELTGEPLSVIHNKVTHNGIDAAIDGLQGESIVIAYLGGNEKVILNKGKEKGVELEAIPIARDYAVFYRTDGSEPGDISAEKAKSIMNGDASNGLKWAVGHTFSDYLPEGVSVYTVDGVLPGSEALKSGEYSAVLNYYAVIRKDSSAGSVARQIISEITSEAGQYAIEEAGYEPL